MAGQNWLVRRAVLAVALMVGFYAMALAIAAALLWIPYAEWVYAERVHARIAFMCIAGACAVLWALVPRADRFEPPGPRLEASTHPRLFKLIHEVASKTRQPMPAEVYLLNEVNAWVTHRGGVMGFGSRRVMGIGLPLLQALSIAQVKAIVAHEFGHYASGDVKLGPWIYKTRAAIGRTISGVRETLLEKPFHWYGVMFLKLTHAVSRQQEFIADRIAVRVAGAPAMASALRRVEALSPVFASYLRNEVTPVLRAGFMPPVASGFDRFLQTQHIADAAEALVRAAEHEGETSLYDTHPSLKDRLAALGAPAASPGAAADEGGEPARTLLGDPDRHARALLEFALGRDNAANLKPVGWEAVAESVYAAQWRELARSHAEWLARLTPDTIPSGRQAFTALGAGLVRPNEYAEDEVRLDRASYLLGAGVGLALLDAGWRAETSPGHPVALVRGDESIDPFRAVRSLAEGVTLPSVWQAQCLRAGIAGRPLGAGVRGAAQTT